MTDETNTTDTPTPATTAPSTLVKLETTLGDIVIQLEDSKAAKTVENFLTYLKSGHFIDTIFHRVIDGFMIQGGGFDKDMQQKDAPKTVVNEADNGLKNDKYTVAMARTNEPHSASSQFFINVKDNDFLNHSSPTQQGWGYAVFGKVVEGMDVIDKIKGVKTGNKGFHQDVPLEPIVVKSTTIIEPTPEALKGITHTATPLTESIEPPAQAGDTKDASES